MRTLVLSCLLVPLAGLGCGDDKKPAADADTTTTTDATATETTADVTPDTATCGGQTGVLDCPCRPDDTCDAGLVCTSGVCTTPVVTPTGLVLPAGARGCEILLAEGGAPVSDVSFAAGVRGTFVREAPRVAIAVVSTSDADFAEGAVTVVGAATPPATVTSARCVDAAGAVLEGAQVTFR